MPALVPLLVLVFATLMLAAQPAYAQVPQTIAESEATARDPGGTVGPITDSDPVMSSADATASTVDFAQATSEATVSGPARSSSEASGASGPGESDAVSVARWTAQLTTTGTDPGGPIDLDLDFNVTGNLTYSNNNAGVGPGDILSTVTAILTVHQAGGATFVFDGTVQLDSVNNSTPPFLNRQDDWAAVARDGDFTSASCTQFSCQYDVATTIAFEDVVNVAFGEVFAVEVHLETDAFILGGFEVGSGADFSNTGTVTPSTDTAGVTIVAGGGPTPVPLLPAAALVLLAGGVLAALRKRAA